MRLLQNYKITFSGNFFTALLAQALTPHQCCGSGSVPYNFVPPGSGFICQEYGSYYHDIIKQK
jgi:hypothetical protein